MDSWKYLVLCIGWLWAGTAHAQADDPQVVLLVDLGADGHRARVVADHAARTVTVDGTALPFHIGDSAHQRSAAGRFLLEEVKLREDGSTGVRVTYSNAVGCVVWGTEDNNDYSRCYTNAATFGLSPRDLQRKRACDESTDDVVSLREGPVRVRVDGCTGMVRVGDHSARFAHRARLRFPYRPRGRGGSTHGNGSLLPGRYVVDTIEVNTGRPDVRVRFEQFVPTDPERLHHSNAHLFRLTENALRRFRTRPGVRVSELGTSGFHFEHSEHRVSSRLPGDGTVRVRPSNRLICKRALRRAGRREPRLSRYATDEGVDTAGARRAIERMGGMSAMPDEMVYRLDSRGLRFRRVGRRLISGEEAIDCQVEFFRAWDEMNAACPFVYVADRDGARTFQGEILRNLREPSLEAWQSLPVQDTESEDMSIVLTEEKPETTYLDALYLERGGERHLPLECRGSERPAYCENDGTYHVLERGDELVVHFPGREEGSAEVATLWAEGHYLPREIHGEGHATD